MRATAVGKGLQQLEAVIILEVSSEAVVAVLPFTTRMVTPYGLQLGQGDLKLFLLPLSKLRL